MKHYLIKSINCIVSDEPVKTCDWVIDENCKSAWMIQVQFDSDLTKYKKVTHSKLNKEISELTNELKQLSK